MPSANSPGALGEGVAHLDPGRSPLRIGRAANNTIVIADSFASRFHAVIEYQAPDWVLTDVSRYGTRRKSRNEPIELLRGTSAKLRHGDLLGFGSADLFFVRGSESLEDGDDVTEPLPGNVALSPRRYATMMELSYPLRTGASVAPASNAEIAEQMVVTIHTVREHLKDLYGAFEIPTDGLTTHQRRALLASQWWRAVLKGSEQG